MSQRIQIPINGITTTSVYTEGDTYSLVNLRPKNGALHPVSPRKIMQELSQKYDIIFVHQNNDYKNWIGVVNDDSTSSVYWKILDSPMLISTLPTVINSVQQIGNTLSLITDESIYYMFYSNNKYIFVGELPEIPSITLSTTFLMYTLRRELSIIYGNDPLNVSPDELFNTTKGMVYSNMDALQNGWNDPDGTYHEGKGYMLFDACFIRYAFRLYDGTLTKHSPPILVLPTENIYDIKDATYQWNYSKLVTTGCYVGVKGYKINMEYDFTLNGDWERWKDIIKSVDIFMSPPVGISNIENIRKDMVLSPNGEWQHIENYQLIKEDWKEANKKVLETSSFYLIRSIDLGESAQPGQNVELPSTADNVKNADSLLQQESMSDDNFSNHKIGAKNSYTYNNRLHISDISTTFFRGFPAMYFRWWFNYNGSILLPVSPCDGIVIQVELDIDGSMNSVYTGIHDNYRTRFQSFFSYPDSRAKRFSIYEKEGKNYYRVFRADMKAHPHLNLSYYLNTALKMIEPVEHVLSDLPADLSVPIRYSDHNKIKVSELNNPLFFPNVNTYQAGAGTILAIATNAMNVSDRNYGQYPLYVFTTQGIWTLNVGSGEVVYSTQTAPAYTEAPTTGVVGETPYGVAFTTQRGLFIINGQSVDFISPQIEQKPLELNIEMNSHCDGVVFAPEHRKFSELLKHVSALIFNPYENELIINSKESEYNYILNFNNQQFYQSTEKITLFADNAFPELFAVNDTTLKDYSSAESPLTRVSFILRPLQYGTPDIKRMERMILNALLYNVTNLGDSKFSLAMSHYSNDGVNFLAAKGYPVNEGNRKDFDMGLFTGTKSRQFLYVFSGVIDEKSQIFNIDAVLEKEYNNTKMR